MTELVRTWGIDSRVSRTSAAERVARPVWLGSVWRPRPRYAFLLVVVALHAGVLALLLLPRIGKHLPTTVPPAIQAQIITLAPVHPEAPPLRPLPLERPGIDLIIPVVPITEPAPDAPTASLPTPATSDVAPPAKVTSGPAAPVIPPRFDAAYLHNPVPVYPLASRRLHERGTVLMRVLVSAQGVAEEVLIQRTSGSPRLDGAAVEAVRRWRFVPARSGSQDVEAWVLVPMEFELQR